jgi:Transposase DNA-binding
MTLDGPLALDFGQHHFGHAQLRHQRRTHCLVELANRLVQHPGGSLPEKFHDPNALRRCYDLMNRPSVTHTTVLDSHRQATFTTLHSGDDTILFLHDTTELDFTGHTTLHEHLGQIGNGSGKGYLCHNSLAVTARGSVVGLAHPILHLRPQVSKGETHAQRRHRQDRESLLWVQAVAALPAPPTGRRWVDVCDRGGDTFEFLDCEQQLGRRYVVRSKHNRRIRVGHHGQGSPVLLHTHLRGLVSQGERAVTIHDHDSGASRETTVQVAGAPVRLLLPLNRRGHYQATHRDVWGVRVWEKNPPAGVEAVEWFLLTNVPVATLADAWERVDWYLQRWIVEEYHKAQKTGCDVEGPQFETVAALEPMIALLSVVALVLLNLRDLSRRPESATEAAKGVVAEEYVQVVSVWRWGDRRALTVQEFVQALGRLGGHQNRRRDGAPGWLVLWRGWMKLQLLVVGYRAGQRAGSEAKPSSHCESASRGES